MRVTLISNTLNAAELLIFTKSTRLNMSPGLLDEIKFWPEEKKQAELSYMAKTIKSSWEFIDVVFLIEGITRATAQQMTRTRNASYAMQSQRVTNMADVKVTNPLDEKTEQGLTFKGATEVAKNSYQRLVDLGVPLEDARGVLPMNAQCNLVAKYNFRALTDLVKARKSLRAQGEYNQIVHDMEFEVLQTWPWAKEFFVSDKEIAIALLEGVARELGVTTGKGQGWEIAKAIDLIRKD